LDFKLPIVACAWWTTKPYPLRLAKGQLFIRKSFDLEVIKGTQGLLDARKVRLIYLELIFQKLYQGASPE
jgi:hypothetical protein